MNRDFAREKYASDIFVNLFNIYIYYTFRIFSIRRVRNKIYKLPSTFIFPEIKTILNEFEIFDELDFPTI